MSAAGQTGEFTLGTRQGPGRRQDEFRSSAPESDQGDLVATHIAVLQQQLDRTLHFGEALRRRLVLGAQPGDADLLQLVVDGALAAEQRVRETGVVRRDEPGGDGAALALVLVVANERHLSATVAEQLLQFREGVRGARIVNDHEGQVYFRQRRQQASKLRDMVVVRNQQAECHRCGPG